MKQLELKTERKSVASLPEIELMDNTIIASPSWSYVQCDARGNITTNHQKKDDDDENKESDNDMTKTKKKSNDITNQQYVGAFRVENIARTLTTSPGGAECHRVRDDDDDDEGTTSSGGKSDTKSETAKSEISLASSRCQEPSAPVVNSVWYPGASDVLVAVAEPVPDYGYCVPSYYDPVQIKMADAGSVWCCGCCNKWALLFLLIGTVILFGMTAAVVMERMGVFSGIFSASDGFEDGAPGKEGSLRSKPPIYLSSLAPSHMSLSPTTAVITFKPTNLPTAVQTPTPTFIKTAPPTNLPCLNWCHSSTTPWKAPRGTPQKCNWTQSCAGCPICVTLSEAPSKSPTDDAPPCFSWCDSNPNPWKAKKGAKQKCDWKKSCAGCSACETTSPSEAPTEAPSEWD